LQQANQVIPWNGPGHLPNSFLLDGKKGLFTVYRLLFTDNGLLIMNADYPIKNQAGIYFITFAVVEWIDVFTRKEHACLVIENLIHYQEKKGLVLHGWCLMSNHLHLIVATRDGKPLSDVLRDFKKITATAITGAIAGNIQEYRRNWMLGIFRSAGQRNSYKERYQFWQQGNQPIELISTAFKEEILNYIHRNPVEAGWVAEPEHYLYSSAVDYAGGQGLVPVTILTSPGQLDASFLL
jgi:putative transposase